MKITDIKITIVDLGDLEKPFWNSIVKTTSKRRARIEIYTDEGIVGMAPSSASSVQRAMILGAIKNKLVGEDPLRIGYLCTKCTWAAHASRSPKAFRSWLRFGSRVAGNQCRRAEVACDVWEGAAPQGVCEY